MQKTKISRKLYWLRQIVQTIAVIVCVLFVLDWWRKPVAPEDFSVHTLSVIGGGQTTLAELSRNRTAVVYFWGSWCSLCKHTSPAIQKLHHAGVPVMGVALQSGSEQQVQAYMADNQINFNTVNDPQGSVARQWQVVATPTVILLKNGNMIHSTTGLSSYWGLRARIWLADNIY